MEFIFAFTIGLVCLGIIGVLHLFGVSQGKIEKISPWVLGVAVIIVLVWFSS